MIKRFFARYPQIPAVTIIIVLWLAASGGHWVDKTLLASPGEVWQQFQIALSSDATRSERVFAHAASTIGRAILGWVIALFLGLALGLLLGYSRTIFRGAEPVVEFVRAVPPVLVFPLLLVAFNYEDGSYVWTVVLGCLPVMIVNVAHAVMGVSDEKLSLLKIYPVNRVVWLYAIGMEMSPGVLLGARLTLSIAVIIAVVTEMVATPSAGWALGALARDSQMEFQTATLYASVFVIGVFGYLANLALRHLAQYLGDPKSGLSEQEG